MLLKRTKLLVGGVAGLLLSSMALADNHGGPTFGIQYRAGLTYDDGKLNETDAVDASSSTAIDLEAIKVTAEGEAAKDVSYKFRYNAENSNVELALATLKAHDMMSLSIGRTKVNQGGWHYKSEFMEYNNTETDWAFGYAASAPFGTFSDAIGLHFNLAGTLTVQLLDDVMVEMDDAGNVTGNAYAKNKTNKGPAATIEWVGNFGGWEPLVQVVSYDLNKSTAYSLGVKGHVAGLGLLANYTADNRKNHSASRKDPETDTLTQIDFHAEYNVGEWTPWLAYHAFDNKQGGKDLDANVDLEAAGVFDGADNAQSIALGVNCKAVGEGYVPYVSISSNSAKYYKSATSTETETRSGMAIKAGVYGKF